MVVSVQRQVANMNKQVGGDNEQAAVCRSFASSASQGRKLRVESGECCIVDSDKGVVKA